MTAKKARRRRKSNILLPDAMLDAHARAFPHAFDRNASLVLYAIRALAQRVNDRANEWLRPLGLNAAKYNYLAILYFSNGDGVTLNEISDLVHTSNAAVTSMVNALEGDGLISRLENPDDGRSYVVALTAKGRSLFEQAVPIHHRHISRAMRSLTERERSLLIDLLVRISAGLLEEAEADS
jgi:DNA-binding MarR family transcriptional regulator